MTKVLAAAASAVFLVGCVEDLPVDSDESAIIGGSEISSDPAVVFLSTGGGNCTATVVAPRVVLTAAHCVSGAGAGSIGLGNGVGQFIDTVGLERLLPHRYYDENVITKFDIAMIRLQDDAAVTPVAINFEPLTADDVGTPVRVIGFGVTDGETQTGAGLKRQANLTIDEVTGEHVGLGDMVSNICQGDSGGPTIRIGDNGPEVIAVSSFGSNFCRDRSFVTRTDTHGEFLREVLSAWGDGPCSLDGECGTDCEFPDPDCDECGLDGRCAFGCARVDLDCPVTGFVGDFCTDNDDCESRQCIEAADDPRIKYCTESCDAENPCTTPLSCQENICQYETTPSAQGAPCTRSTDCRSGLCDASNLICVEPCSSDDDCPDPFACESLSGMQVCTVPSEGGCGCGAVSQGSRGRRQALGTLVLIFVGLIGYGAALRRRRRRIRIDY